MVPIVLLSIIFHFLPLLGLRLIILYIDNLQSYTSPTTYELLLCYENHPACFVFNGYLLIYCTSPQLTITIYSSRCKFCSSALVYSNTGFYGEKILYKNLDLAQDSPNKILFHFLERFLWKQNLVQKS